MNPKLKEELEKEAFKFAAKNSVLDRNNFAYGYGFQEGALWMADKYAPLVKALKEIVSEGELGGSGTDADIARKALQEIGEGKDE